MTHASPRYRSLFAAVLAALCLVLAGCPARLPASPDAGRSVRLSFSDPDARTVAVAGSFNRWDSASHAMTGPDRRGRWTITLRLPPGGYEYRFIVNGTEWAADPGAPSIDDGFGGWNSVLVVH